MLRVHAHVEHPAFYEAANTAGILIWQDFPLQWTYQKAILGEARRQVAQMVDMLYNHPAIVIWCMHNEPIHVADTKDDRFITRMQVYASVFVFSWSRDVLDTQLKEITEARDRTRPAIRSSGEYAIPGWHEGTDSHFYYGWYSYYGRLHSWPKLIRAFPKLIRFVTEFGTQSFPNLESSQKFIDPDITQIDWDHIVERHHFQSNMMALWLDWRKSASLEDLVRLTQDYQIEVNRFYIDRLRYYKYRPTGGIVPFMFHDSNPAVQWSIIDYWRVPKRSYAAMRTAFSPQYLFSILDEEVYQRAAPVEIPIYVVNDAHRAVPVLARATLRDPEGRELAAIERALTLPGDCMAAELERLRLTPTLSGAYTLTLTLQPDGGERIDHSYVITVA
jgi:beta-mannosidase